MLNHERTHALLVDGQTFLDAPQVVKDTIYTKGEKFVENWFLMIFLGTLHSVFSFIPAAGFWTVLWFNILLGIIINIVRQNVKASK